MKELLQYNIAEGVKNEMSRILYEKDYRDKMLVNYKELHERVGEPGSSARIAEAMIDDLIPVKD